jgi:hypothetical protein
LNTRSEIVITIRRGDWTFEVKNTVEDEDLVPLNKLAQTLTDMADSVGKHLESPASPTPVESNRQPF